MNYQPGMLRLAVMGDLLRHPGTTLQAVAGRLEVADPNTVRVTLRRLTERGLVRRVTPSRFMLGRAGIEHLATVRRWVSV